MQKFYTAAERVHVAVVVADALLEGRVEGRVQHKALEPRNPV